MEGLLVIFLIIVGLMIYFIPTIVAKNRGHHNTAAIFCVNLFLGWMLIGWVAALVWACLSSSPQYVVLEQGQTKVEKK